MTKSILEFPRGTSFNGINLFDGSLAGGLRLQAGYGADGSIQSTLGEGLGSGSFLLRASCTGSVMGLNFGVTTGDLNGDGILDLVTAGYTYDGNCEGQISVFIGRGDGSFNSETSYATQIGNPGDGMSEAVALGDVNGDGILDLVAAGRAHDDGAYQGEASVLLGRGDGTFGAAIDYATITGLWGGSNDVALGDLNGDGIADLVTAGYAHNGANQGAASVLLGLGDGSFGSSVTFVTNSGSVSSTNIALALGDLNGDGILDLVTAGTANDGAGTHGLTSVLLGAGDGTFAPAVSYLTQSGSIDGLSFDVQLGDVNGDGTLDIVTAGSVNNGEAQGEGTVLLGRGDGTFGSAGTYSTGDGTNRSRNYALSLGDVNGDGLLDVVTAGYVQNGGSQGQAWVLLGSGDGTFDSNAAFVSAPGALWSVNRAVTLGDANGDGILDIITAGSSSDGAWSNYLSVLNGVAREGISPLLPFSLATKADALQALAPLDRKIAQLSAQRGVIGAFQSRLGAALGTLSSTTENFTAAESRIRDADIASEAAELARLEISKQAAAAVLAQANQEPALAVRLLRT